MREWQDIIRLHKRSFPSEVSIVDLPERIPFSILLANQKIAQVVIGGNGG